MKFFRHEGIESSDGARKEIRWGPDLGPRPSLDCVSGWIFLGELLSSRARLRFSNRHSCYAAIKLAV